MKREVANMIMIIISSHIPIQNKAEKIQGEKSIKGEELERKKRLAWLRLWLLLDIRSSVKRDFPSSDIFEWAPEKHNCKKIYILQKRRKGDGKCGENQIDSFKKPYQKKTIPNWLVV